MEDASKSVNEDTSEDITARVYHVTIPGTFVEVH